MRREEQRFEVLYRDHATQVLAYLRRRTDRETAHDVAAEVFTVVWRRLAEVPDPPLPWLLGVARKQLANSQRASRRRRLLQRRMAQQPAHSPGPPGAAATDVSDVAAALAVLSDDDRELLTLVGWDELTPTEAAAVLAISARAARTRLHRARRRLEAQLDVEERQP
jgi:RNA polymerase sigma-70 factor, ECF subfamily